MTARFLLDANVLSESAKPAPDPRVVEKLDRFRAHLATASVAWHELLYGLEVMPPGGRRHMVERLAADVLSCIPILPYDRAAAAWHAKERARLRAAGVAVPFADGQIAAIARVNDLVLVTRNERDFRHFRDLEVERWHARRP